MRSSSNMERIFTRCWVATNMPALVSEGEGGIKTDPTFSHSAAG